MFAGGVKSPAHTAAGPGSVPNGDVEGRAPGRGTQDEGGREMQENGGSTGAESANLSNGRSEGGANEHSSPLPPPSAASVSETTPPDLSQPAIPPRPYRPPRPFPPPTAAEKSPNTSPSHSTRSRHGKRAIKTHHGDPRYVGTVSPRE